MAWQGRLRSISLALLLSGSSLACASSGFDGHIYHNGELRFRVGQVPSSWRAIDVDDALLAFRDDPANATIALNGRCGIDGDDVPLSALTQHLFLQFSARDVGTQTALGLDGREALRTEVTAALDGVKKHYVVYVLKKNSCVYDFMYISAAEAAPVAEFDGFVHGFRTLD